MCLRLSVEAHNLARGYALETCRAFIEHQLLSVSVVRGAYLIRSSTVLIACFGYMHLHRFEYGSGTGEWTMFRGCPVSSRRSLRSKLPPGLLFYFSFVCRWILSLRPVFRLYSISWTRSKSRSYCVALLSIRILRPHCCYVAGLSFVFLHRFPPRRG